MSLHSRERSCTLADLDDLDLNHRVTFQRRSDDTTRPAITGRLIDFEQTTYLTGMMRRSGVSLTVGFPSVHYGENIETFGPFPLRHPITIGRPMRRRASPDDELPRRPHSTPWRPSP